MSDDMIFGAKNALEVVLSLKDQDKVLIVTDLEKQVIGKTFQIAAEELGAEVTLYTFKQDARPLKELPEDLSSIVTGHDVIINAFSGIPEETPFRIKLIKHEITTNARVGHAPGITVEMMREGPMTADYAAVAEQADHLMELFTDAKKVHITTPGGTDLFLNIESREFETDVLIKAGTVGNLPAGEIWCAPAENGANGTIVCDGSIGDIGQVPSPLTIHVKNGRIVSMENEDSEFKARVWELTHIDEMADVIGELGIGLNPMAKLTGNLLEDEKAGETAHVAFGNNTEMPNGRNNSSTHRDFLFYKPDILVTYKDDSKIEIMREGKIIA